MGVRVELIAIGNELLLGKRIDSNTAFIGRALAEIGLDVVCRATVGDGGPELEAAVRRAWDRAAVTIACGGLGPTVDDVTREALVAATGISLREEPEIVDAMRQRFAARGRDMPERNRCQAWVPTQGRWFANGHGTAPGLVFEGEGRVLIALPGPPNELQPMVNQQLLPYLAQRFPACERWLRHSMRFSGLPESYIDHDLRPLLAGHDAIDVSLLPSLGVIELTLSKRVATGCERDAELDDLVAAVKSHFGKAIFAEGTETLPETVGRLLRARGQMLALAESCTGGMIAGQITEIPGSSDYFAGGIVAYGNDVKRRLLGVREATLVQHGAVSVETAREMAAGAREALGTGVGLAVTGIAGPGGGSEDKPVGTVCVAACDGEREEAWRERLIGDRTEVRKRAVVLALTAAYRLLAGG